VELRAQQAVQQNACHFVNRLSDFFFVAARFAAHHANEPEMAFKASEYGEGSGFPLPTLGGGGAATAETEAQLTERRVAALECQASNWVVGLVPAAIAGVVAACVTLRLCR
jgi:hypothetical protein